MKTDGPSEIAFRGMGLINVFVIKRNYTYSGCFDFIFNIKDDQSTAAIEEKLKEKSELSDNDADVESAQNEDNDIRDTEVRAYFRISIPILLVFFDN